MTSAERAIARATRSASAPSAASRTSIRPTRLAPSPSATIASASCRSTESSRPSGSDSPLDPLAWDRKLLRDLFGFEYLWEVYTPAAKRRHGYYVLPLLFGDRFAGRIEPRFERRSRTLHVVGIWFEPGFDPMAEPHFTAALGEALRAYRSFVGAETVTWPDTRVGRGLAEATA